MPPRNRPASTASTSPPSNSITPSSTPPNPSTAGLTKRQRQALRIHRPPLPPPEPEPVIEPEPVPEPEMSDAAFTPPAESHMEAIRIRDYRRPVSEERERASPSKYPTPLPDEEEEEEEGDVLPIGRSPDGTLIDMQDEEPLVAAPAPTTTRPVGYPARSREGTRATLALLLDEDSTSTLRKQHHRRRRSPSSPSHPPAFHSTGGGHAQHAHMRAPEMPRHSPLRALGALSHTLRSALAASTQAETSATAYAQGSYSTYSASPHANLSTHDDLHRRVGGSAGMRHGEEEEQILAARSARCGIDDVLPDCLFWPLSVLSLYAILGVGRAAAYPPRIIGLLPFRIARRRHLICLTVYGVGLSTMRFDLSFHLSTPPFTTVIRNRLLHIVIADRSKGGSNSRRKVILPTAYSDNIRQPHATTHPPQLFGPLSFRPSDRTLASKSLSDFKIG
ncbi:hypothetical protein B0H19DRAFT_1240876 [Mycena capillaripes]|nr:hypothetical protein B0H19DRAFT_1240876 [Mycena capillaripes]